ncbi:hypothetical protein SAMN05443247_07185 [Bradyrhizobium erythrophlei]|jgi:hypothetical protein|nr:hypothetical protein SAMN05443247_07185 [Bradyrhizobium erythrophlei]
MWRYAYRFPNPSLRDRRYKIHVQDSWSFGAIEQHGDAGGTRADVDNDAAPVSQLWASNGSKLTHLEASADKKSAGFLTHH